jgi:signal transduction histidine kinase
MREPGRLWRYLAQPGSDRAIAAIFAIACLAELFAKSGLAPAPLAVAEVIVACAPLVLLRTHPVAATWLVAGMVLIAPGLTGSLDLVGLLVACALSYSCGSHASLRDGGLAVAGLVVALQVSMGFSEFPNVEIGFATLVPFWVGREVGVRSALVSKLAQRTRELEHEQDAFARLAVRRERARIARELHDIVSHHLAVIVVQAGAGRLAALGPNQQAPERFAAIRQSGLQALTEMGRLVDLLHAEDQREHGASGRWRLLVDQARTGGIDVQLTPLPPEVQLPHEVEDNAYRIVREALTNAIKHAPGARVTVRLALNEHELEIDVHDNGSHDGAPLLVTGSGLGLIGMRERLQQGGGTLQAGPDPGGGWRLHATLPIAVAALTPTR